VITTSARAQLSRKLRDDRVGLVRDRDIAIERHAPSPELRSDKSQVTVRCQPEQQFIAQREQFIAEPGDRLAR
jgi:hypothetical protein